MKIDYTTLLLVTLLLVFFTSCKINHDLAELQPADFNKAPFDSTLVYFL
jgi:hypothetical protein